MTRVPPRFCAAALVFLCARTTLAGPTPVIELPDGVTSVPLHRDAALPALALVDAGQLVGVVHRMKGDKSNVPRLAVLDLNGNARIEMGRITRADGTVIVNAGLVFYDEDRSPRLAVEGGRVLRVSEEGPIESVGGGAKVSLEDVKGHLRATSDAKCTTLHDEKGAERARICGTGEGARIAVGKAEIASGSGEDELAGATDSGLRFVDRKGRGSKLAGVPCHLPALAVPSVGTIKFKQRAVKGGVALRMLF